MLSVEMRRWTSLSVQKFIFSSLFRSFSTVGVSKLEISKFYKFKYSVVETNIVIPNKSYKNNIKIITEPREPLKRDTGG